jgi:flagellar basal body-associated protein FliL
MKKEGVKKEFRAKLIITLISVFVFVLAVLLIVFIFEASKDFNQENYDENNLPKTEQMKLECINIGCLDGFDYIYAGSKNSDKYYECSCRYAKNILPENLICFASEDEAEAEGREKVDC